MKRCLIAVIVGISIKSVWALDVPYRARTADGGTPGQWLSSISASARTAGLGNASTAISGPEMAFSNPAGIIGDQTGMASFLFTPLYSGGRVQALSASYPINFKSSGGISLLYMESGEAEKTNAFGQTVGNFDEQDLGMFLTYGRRMLARHLDAGANFKMVRQSLDGYSATGLGSDMGIILHWFDELLNVGLAYQNILPPTLTLKQEKDKFPLTAKLGVSVKTQIANRPFLVCADRSSSSLGFINNANAWGFGAEIQPFRIPELPISIRFGINQKEYTFGLGVEKGLVVVDYAASLNELGILHRVGISIHFGSQVSRDEARISDAWERIRAKEAALRALEVKVKRGRSREPDTSDEDAHAEKTSSVNKIPEQNKLTPVMEIILINQAKAYYDKKEYENCLDSLKEIDAFNKMKNQALFIDSMSRAHLFIEEEKYPETLDQLNKAIEINSGDNEALSLFEKVKDISEVNGDEIRK